MVAVVMAVVAAVVAGVAVVVTAVVSPLWLRSVAQEADFERSPAGMLLLAASNLLDFINWCRRV